MAKRDARDSDELEGRLRFRSPHRVSPSQGGGISPLDLLELPSELRQVMNVLIRQGPCTVAQLAGSLAIDQGEAFCLLDTLAARGHVRRHGQEDSAVFEPILGHSGRPGLSSALWDKLKEG